MSKPSHQFAFVALAFWLLSSWAGAYGHFCFDGQEPAVSVHMDMMGHTDHHPDEAHQDADIDLVKSVIAKLMNIDVAMVLLAALALALLILPTAIFRCTYSGFYSRISLYWRPLLRAPPVAV